MTNLSKALFLLALPAIMLMSACSDDGNNKQTIAEIAAGDPDLTSLVAAMEQAGVTATFDGTDEFTVFAPSNAAFDAALVAFGVDSLPQIPNLTLLSVLNYHVVAGTNLSTGLTDGFVNTAAAGPGLNPVPVYINTTTGVKVNMSTVTTADIQASNGVIHKVDAVIAPATVVDHALNFPDFTVLAQALTTAGLVGTLMDTDETYTVFAPTDAAFNTFLTNNSLDINTLDSATLAPILLNHVLIGSNVRSDQLSAGTVTMASGTIEVETSPTISINDSISVSTADIQAFNGVVHVIDKVID